MIRRQWKYEESGEESTVSRQMMGSAGMSAAAVGRMYSGSPTRAGSVNLSSSKVAQNLFSNKTSIVATPSVSKFPSSEISKNKGLLKSTDVLPVAPKPGGLTKETPDTGLGGAEKGEFDRHVGY